MTTLKEIATTFQNEVDRLTEELHYLKTTKQFEIKILEDNAQSVNETNWKLIAEVGRLRSLLEKHGIDIHEPPLDTH